MKTTKTKKLLITLLSALMLVCISISGMFLATNKVKADGVEQASEAAFRVVDGASVRTIAGSSGIRFTTKISGEFYQTATENNATWHTIIAYGVEDPTTITIDLANASATDGVYEYTPHDPDTKEPVTIAPFQDATTGDYYYQTVITFDTTDKTEHQIAQAFNQKINVRSYVKYGDDTVTYSYAGDGEGNNVDTYRSIKQVAELVMVDDAAGDNLYSAPGLSAQKAILSGYITGANVPVTYSQLAYLEDMYADRNKTFAGLKMANGSYNATLNGASLGEVEVTDGSFSISTLPDGLILGEYYTIVLNDDEKVYAQQVRYVSDAIETYAEFDSIITFYRTTTGDTATSVANIGAKLPHELTYGEDNTAKYYDKTNYSKRFYVLANNITADKLYAHGVVYSGKAVDYPTAAFFDDFDGQGYTIDVGAYGPAFGVFAYLANGSSVKNVNIKIDTINAVGQGDSTPKTGSYQQARKFVGLAMFMQAATVENVSLTIGKYTDQNDVLYTQGLFPFVYQIKDVSSTPSIIKNVYLYVKQELTYSSTSAAAAKEFHGYLAHTVDANSKNNITNFFAVTTLNNAVQTSSTYAANESSDDATHVKYAGVYHYASLTNEESATQNVTKVGDWKIGTDGLATWDKASSGSVTVDASAFTNFYNKIELLQLGYLEDMYAVGQKTFTGLGVENGTFNAYLNGASLGEVAVEVTDGSFSISVLPDGLTLGETYLLELVNATDDADVYLQTVKYVSMVIDTQAELGTAISLYKKTDDGNNASHCYDGQNFTQRYFVLNEDITLVDISGNNATYYTGSAYPFEFLTNRSNPTANAYSSMHTFIFKDIFDGNGHTIDCGNFLPADGLFGNLGSDVVIKNLAINAGQFTAIGSGNNGQTRVGNIIAYEFNYGVKLENLALTLNRAARGKNGTAADAQYPLIGYYMKDASLKDVFIYTKSPDTVAEDGYQYLVCGSSSSANGGYIGTVQDGASFERVVVVSLIEHAFKYDDDITKASDLTGITHYSTLSAFQATNTTKVGSWEIAFGSDSNSTASFTWSETVSATPVADELEVKAVKTTLTDNEEVEVLIFADEAIFKGYVAMTSNDESVVAIENGKVKAVASGTAEVTVAYQIFGEVVIKTIHFTVT